MTERNSADAWEIIKRDSLFLEAVCRYLESEQILTGNQKEIFKKLWFCKMCPKEEKQKKEKTEQKE